MPASDSQVIQRTEGPTSKMWEQYKPIIRDLYIRQNRPLKEVIFIMKVSHGLVARYVAPPSEAALRPESASYARARLPWCCLPSSDARLWRGLNRRLVRSCLVHAGR